MHVFGMLSGHVRQDERDQCSRTTVVHNVSHLLCAVIALGSAMCKTLNSMFVTPLLKCMQWC